MPIITTVISLITRYAIPLALIGMLIIGYFGNTLFQALNAPRETRATVTLESIQSLSELSVVKYNFSSIVTTEREMPGILAGLYGERQAMVAVGHVRAGIDLGQMTEDDVIRSDDILVITLPPPTLHDCYLNENDSYVVFRDTGIFARNTPDLDSSARSYAIEQFRTSAIENNIMQEVNIQAQAVIQEFLEILESDIRIRILTQNPDPDAPIPDTCL